MSDHEQSLADLLRHHHELRGALRELEGSIAHLVNMLSAPGERSSAHVAEINDQTVIVARSTQRIAMASAEMTHLRLSDLGVPMDEGEAE